MSFWHKGAEYRPTTDTDKISLLIINNNNVRFAKSPTGPLRWQLPVPYEPEESLYDVTGKSEIKCKQFSWDGVSVVGTEDCLFLNVYVPGQSAKRYVQAFHSNALLCHKEPAQGTQSTLLGAFLVY